MQPVDASEPDGVSQSLYAAKTSIVTAIATTGMQTDEPSDQTVLITGGAGFIGGHLATALVPDNDVRILDSLTTGRRANVPTRQRSSRTISAIQTLSLALPTVSI